MQDSRDEGLRFGLFRISIAHVVRKLYRREDRPFWEVSRPSDSERNSDGEVLEGDDDVLYRI
jgi:hypothetical protein